MNSRRWALFALSVGWLGLLGCGGGGPTPISVKGVLTIDGKPEADVVVNFVNASDPGKTPATGQTDAEGRFTLSTFNMNDGAIPGAYKVTVARTAGMKAAAGATSADPQAGINQLAKMTGEAMSKTGAPPAAPAIPPLPDKYASPTTTPLNATVGTAPPGQTDFKFEVATAK